MTSMEVEAGPSTSAGRPAAVMAAAGTSPSVTVQLHPLVILNISEHWTRIRAQQAAPRQVLGALIGQQKGRNVEIMNSFELVFDTVDGQIVVDTDYYAMKEEQFKQVFEHMDLVGWYTTGGAPDASDISVHKQVCKLNESALLVKLNPQASCSELPITVLESVMDIVDGDAQMLLLETGYTLATEEAERIGVDHVARVTTSESGDKSVVAESLVPHHGALKMLRSRVSIIVRYIKAMQAGQVPVNYDILREAYSISHRLPVLESSQFTQDLFTQMNDVTLMTYLGALTKGCDTTLQYVNKFNTLHDKQGVGRRMRGMFF
ncbi:COP9 signalosome complex subunit 6-like [Pollicipes pollicipes]|uniref:COP9 signalosome complex subunit 6-like n=1 Tax=Pollicipes pollicipes TaxID=41117 RepID=UPI001884F5E9|nr:COP9 signalosome complex subunit 6-like [Pollicipes pollicipes]XP_037089311.1 COP9 signalosome complex subunit 6-like [Pollicipes pollicipes]XP_037089312.1 COP9 signalosome complex subunit 6-like [Pollicipes pollicipes]